MTLRNLFITGTDTGVGKTVVSCALARAMRSRGLDPGVMKPIETGVEDAGPQDAQALRAAVRESDAPLSLICPQTFALPAAPNVAAAAESRRVDLGAIDAAYAQLSAAHSGPMLIEGAGGVLVPVDDDTDMLDLALRFDSAVLLVARAALGTINHTLLSLREIERRGLDCIGVVVSHSAGPLSSADAQNLGHLREQLGEFLLGEIPPLAAHEVSSAETAIDLDRLISRLAAP